MKSSQGVRVTKFLNLKENVDLFVGCTNKYLWPHPELPSDQVALHIFLGDHQYQAIMHIRSLLCSFFSTYVQQTTVCWVFAQHVSWAGADLSILKASDEFCLWFLSYFLLIIDSIRCSLNVLSACWAFVNVFCLVFITMTTLWSFERIRSHVGVPSEAMLFKHRDRDLVISPDHCPVQSR